MCRSVVGWNLIGIRSWMVSFRDNRRTMLNNVRLCCHVRHLYSMSRLRNYDRLLIYWKLILNMLDLFIHKLRFHILVLESVKIWL